MTRLDAATCPPPPVSSPAEPVIAHAPPRLPPTNRRDQLGEMCALFGTSLADEDGVYDPHDSNDPLLLGLKGTISEFELITMHNRLERGKLNKAQRGELFYCVPTGYVKVTSDQVDLD